MQPRDDAPGIECNIDRLDRNEISGWIIDLSDPDRKVQLELLVNGELVCRIAADQFRPDLKNDGRGDGHAGFTIRPISSLMAGPVAWVRLQVAGTGQDILGGAAVVVLEEHGFDRSFARLLDQAVTAAVNYAPELATLDHLLSTLLGHARLVMEERDRWLGGQRDEAGADAIARLLGGLPPLHLDGSDVPAASVIIPVHNKFELTHGCISSLIEHLPEAPFEVIIVDDASSDETLLASVAFSGGIRVLRNAANLGFVGSCNAGAAVARGHKLLFLNNDTIVRPGWLDELLASFERDPRIGVAGSRLLFPDGVLQECGGLIWRLGDGWNWGRGQDATDPRYRYMRDADYVSGAALMVDAGLFRSLNGFDTLFSPAYYEDTDLCFRVRAMGRRVVVQPASEIIHLEGQSNGTDVNGSGLKRYQKLNLHKFRKRWAGLLATHRMNGDMAWQEVERHVQRRALFIDDSVPTPDQDAGSNAAFQHMLALQARGYKVVFVPADNMARIDPYTAMLEKHGIECLYHPWFSSLEEVFRKQAAKADLVYIHRFVNASKYIGMIRRFLPEAHVLYCVADLHFLRMQREAELTGDPVKALAAEHMRHDELAMVAAADCTIVHSDVEAALLRETLPEAGVATVPWTIRVRPTMLPFQERHGAAFLGGFRHPPNIDAVTWLGTEIRPRLEDIPVTIYGADATDEVWRQHSGMFRVAGHVPDLAVALHQHRCTIAPLRFGAGIKGKVLESFAHGLPCVMTPIAAEGLKLPKLLQWLVADDADGIAAKVLAVHSDDAVNAGFAAAGLQMIEQRYGAEVVGRALGEAIDIARRRSRPNLVVV